MNNNIEAIINSLTVQQRRVVVGHGVAFTSTHDWQFYVDAGIYHRHDYEDRYFFCLTELGSAIFRAMMEGGQDGN